MNDFRQILVPPNLIPSVIGNVIGIAILAVIAYGALEGLAALINTIRGG